MYVGSDEVNEFVGIEEQLARLRAEGRAKSRQVMVMLALLATLGWYFYGMRDWFDWDFATHREAPLSVGNPMESGFVLPPHNSFVTIEGLTDYRGVQQSRLRGLTGWTKEYKYLKLTGANIFLEVPAGDETVSGTQRVAVEGRVVDPSFGQDYRAILDYYSDQFGKAKIEKARIIQVGLKPGAGKSGWFMVGAFLLGLFSLNLYTLFALFRVRRSVQVIRADAPPT